MQNYYFAQRLIQGWGNMYFLKILQEASASGGGESLLGSVVQSLDDYWLIDIWPFASDYPAPLQMSTPQSVLTFMKTHATAIFTPPPTQIVVDIPVAASAQTNTFDRKDVYSIGAGPFPSLPLTLAIDVDYSKLDEITVSYGAGAVLKYIPMGFYGALYKFVAGDFSKVDTNVNIKDNFVVDSVLLANNFSVTFKSREAFGADFQTKLSQFQNIPSIGASVKYSCLVPTR
jgi:hypothetical protein